MQSVGDVVSCSDIACLGGSSSASQPLSRGSDAAPWQLAVKRLATSIIGEHA